MGQIRPMGIGTRTTGQYPISVGSSLALEGLFGTHEKIVCQKTINTHTGNLIRF